MPSSLIFARASLAALLLLPAFPALAVPDVPLVYNGPVDLSDPAEQLSRYLRDLAERPRDLVALTGAGRAALALGDASAALGFFARADDVSPRNGRVKAGLGAALVQMEQPREALKLFAEAVSLGVPEADIASDRGLARDLRGDSHRAQADYALALRSRPDPETTRRLALSMAISGDRAGALATLDPLIQRGDKAAGRARAFVLALTGDAPGAERVALAAMPAPQVSALAPFLLRLPALKAGQKAAAVNLGHFPASGRRYTDAELFADAESGARPATTARPGMPPVIADIGESGDEPVFSDTAPSAATARANGGIAAKAAGRSRSKAGGTAPGGTAADGGGSVAVAKPSAPSAAPVRLAQAAAPAPAPGDDDAARAARAQADAEVWAREQALARARAEAAARLKAEADAKAKARAAVDARAKASAEADAQAKAEARAKADAKAKADARAKADAEAKEKAEAAAKAKAEAKARAAEPERYWVQVASGKNKGDLGKVWNGLVDRNPKLLRGRATWTAPWRASNRLLTGPFKTDDEAQAFVNTLAKAGMSGIQFTTRAGVKVEKLDLK